MNGSRWHLSVSLLALLLFLSMPRSLPAQNAATAELRGSVHDLKSAAVPNASITIQDDVRGYSRTVSSDLQGSYEIPLLPPGRYTVTVTASGFAQLIDSNVVLNVGQKAVLPLALTVAPSFQQVTVNANAELVETARSSESTTVDQRRIDSLPINGRNYINFTLTNSQIARDAAPSVGAIPTSGLNFGGARARANAVNVDGADAGDYIGNGVRATVSQDAVQEFQILTNGFAAEYGRASGGVVNIVTRSGTNDMHGAAYGYVRNRDFQARNAFSNVSNPAYTRVQSGFTLGGPIRKDHTFYFFSTEITRRQETGFSDIGANDFSLLNIDASRFYGYPGGSINIQGTPEQKAFLNSLPAAAAANPGIQQYVALIASSSGIALTGNNPAFLQPQLGAARFITSGAALPQSFIPLNSLIGNFPISEKTEVYSLRLDHKINGAQQLMLRANVSPSHLTGIQENAQNQNFGENAFSRTAIQTYHDVSTVAQHVWVLSSNKVNEFRIQFSRHPIKFSNSDAPGGSNVAVDMPGYAYFGKTPFSVVDRVEKQVQLQNNFTVTRGGHTFKAGVDVRYVPLDFRQGQLFNAGEYTFGSLEATNLSPALVGLPGFSPVQAYGLGIPQAFVQGIGQPRLKYNEKVLGAFIQDSFRLHSRLTLNYGLRYDIESVPTQNALNANTTAAERAFGVQEGIPLRTGNLAPRLGIAFDPRGNGKSAIRASFGIFYDRPPGDLEPQSLVFNANTVPLVIIAGGSPCDASSNVSPLNLNATNVFQGTLSNANCLPIPSFNYQPNQQNFKPDNSNSLFNNQNYLAAGFPLPILPSGLPADAHSHTPYAEQASLAIEQDLGRDLSLNVAYSFTAAHHLNRPVNVNPVNPALLVQNWRAAVAAVQAGTAGTSGGTPLSAVASPTSNPLLVATASGTAPCGAGPAGPYVTPALLNFFRKSGVNISLAQFLQAQGAGQCVALADQIAAANGLGVGLPVPFGDMTPNLTNGNSNYNALSVNLRKRFSANYEFLVSYTWSHAIDDSTDVVSTSQAPQNNFNASAERASSAFDQRHRIVLSGVYHSGNLHAGVVSALLRNFTVAPIVEIASGRPFNIVTGQDSNFDFDPLTDRPNAVSPTSGATGCGSTAVISRFSPLGAFNLPCYIDAPANATAGSSYFNGNLGRNTGVKPYVVFVDLRIARDFSLGERLKLQVIADGFNLLNHFNVLDVNPLYSDAGRPTAAFDPRQFQFALRLSF